MHHGNHFWFFAPHSGAETLLLPPEEGRHAQTVLRAREGTEITVTDGKGGVMLCRIVAVSPAGLRARVLHRRTNPPFHPPITLMAGIPDRGAFEQLLENTVPLGVTTIVPVICLHCQKSWWNGWDKLIERFQRIIVTAAKQSHNPWFPRLEPPIAFSPSNQAAPVVIIAALGGEPPPHLTTPAELWIGPPGGFSPDEHTVLEQRGGIPTSLGPCRLRTELAAAAALTLLRSC